MMFAIERSLIGAILLPLALGTAGGVMANAIWSDPRLAAAIAFAVLAASTAVFLVVRLRARARVLGRMRIYPTFQSARSTILSSALRSTRLDVIAIRGSHIFEGDLFQEIVRRYATTKGRLRILLLSPRAEAMQNYLHHTTPAALIDEYVRHSNAMVNRLSRYRDKGIDISVRYYTDTPLWKLIMTDHDCFFIGYTVEERGHSLPLVHVEKGDNCFAVALERHFSDLWLRHANRRGALASNRTPLQMEPAE